MLTPPPKGGPFSFLRRKEYGLFLKETRQTPHLVQRFPKFLNQPEVEAMLADGFDDTKGYIYAEIDGAGQIKQVMWTKRQPKAAAAPSKPAWERLEDDVTEAVKPLESLGRAMQKLGEVIDTFRGEAGGGSGVGGEGGTGTNPEDDPMGKALELQRKFYDSLFDNMAKSMGSAMTQMVMPWSIPSNFPQWAQMMMHPGFRQGLKETISETIEDLTKTVTETAAGAAIRASRKSEGSETSGLPTLSELSEKAKKAVKNVGKKKPKEKEKTEEKKGEEQATP